MGLLAKILLALLILAILALIIWISLDGLDQIGGATKKKPSSLSSACRKMCLTKYKDAKQFVQRAICLEGCK
jgi:type II secretory pathway component PulJ